MSDERPIFDFSLVLAEKRSRFDPLKNFTPERLVTYLDAFRFGRLRDLARTMDAIDERDDTLACVVPKAKSGVARHGWDIIIGETADEGEKKLAQDQKKALRHFYNNIRVTSALDQDELGGCSLLLRQMMDAKGKRYACHNIVWRPDGKGNYSATLWQLPLWFFENMAGKMRFISVPFGYDGDEMAPEEWLVTKGLGVSIATTVAFMYKNLSLRDWVIYNQRNGMPGFEGITDHQPGTEGWQNMVNAVSAAAKEFAWVRNRTEEIKTIEFGTTGALPYPALVERMDRALAALWRGADLSTISAGGGRGQGASVQAEETMLLEQDDAKWLSETLNLKLDRLVLDYVFGPETPALAYFKVLGANERDFTKDLEVDKFALEAGHPISSEQFAERYNRPLPDPQDTLLKFSPAIAADPLSNAGDPLKAAANEAQAATAAQHGREAIFKSSAMAGQIAARRPVFRPLAQRLAALAAMTDPAQMQAAVETLRGESTRLYAEILAKAPDLAKPAEQAIGTALVSGMADHAAEHPPISKP